VINLKPNGVIVWTSEIPADTFQSNIVSYAVQEKEGLFRVSGIYWDSRGSQSRFVARLDQNGRILNQKILPVPPRYNAWFCRILPRTDGSFFLVNNYHAIEWQDPDILEVDLLDADGNLIRDKFYEDVYINPDQISLSSSDGLIIPGTLDHGIFDGSPDFLFIQIDKDGYEILHKVFGTYVNWENGNYCIEDNGNGFIYSGTTVQSSTATVFHISNDGEVSEPIYIEKYKIYSGRNYILKTQAPGYMMMSYIYDYFMFVRLDEDFSFKWSIKQIIRSPSQSGGTESSCHFVPASNGRFTFAYVSDEKILLFRTRSY